MPVNRDVLLKMSAKDVIHSFYLPHARVKQDLVPGMMTKVWFSIKKHAVYDIGDDPFQARISSSESASNFITRIAAETATN